MFYYEISLVSTPLPPLVYCFKTKIATGNLVEVLLKTRVVKGYITKEVGKPSFECKEISNVLPFYLPFSYLKIANFISEYYICSFGEALGLFVPFSSKVKEEEDFCSNYKEIQLSPDQLKALNFLKNNPVSLLFGDTGSGKSEIYFEFIKDKLKNRKKVILLMPEISLTPQMEKRLKYVFGEEVAVWHSKVTKRKKEKILENIYKGKIKIVAGARSALFLPLRDLGAIIVDEEHDDSYKSKTKPKYNAKDLAVFFGKTLGINVVLGSATPLVTSFFKYPFFRLKGGYFEAKRELEFANSFETLPREIIAEIENTLKQNAQILIFLPTKANFKYLVCKKCKRSIKCPFCEVGMSIYFQKNALVCHYCNFSQPIPKNCPDCHSNEMLSLRIGTAEIVNELRNYFPDKRIEKFDRDEITSLKKLQKILFDFSKGKIDILVGTQMLSKGHDYPNIKLAVILGIDYILNMADFRARERAVSLFVQIAGRTGRKEKGKVIVQTCYEDFFRRYFDYEIFLRDELKRRKEIYPPFKKIVAIYFAHQKEEIAQKEVEKALEIVKNFQEVEIIGKGKAPIEKIASKYRFLILIRSSKIIQLLKVAKSIQCKFCEIDVEPVAIF
jgi:primosomal protein N' (replication factor Y)